MEFLAVLPSHPLTDLLLLPNAICITSHYIRIITSAYSIWIESWWQDVEASLDAGLDLYARLCLGTFHVDWIKYRPIVRINPAALPRHVPCGLNPFLSEDGVTDFIALCLGTFHVDWIGIKSLSLAWEEVFASARSMWTESAKMHKALHTNLWNVSWVGR